MYSLVFLRKSEPLPLGLSKTTKLLSQDFGTTGREMKILVIAATGNLGKAIVNAALRDGHDVSVLVRDGTKVPWNGEQLTKVYVSASGSLGDQVGIALAGDTFDAVA